MINVNIYLTILIGTINNSYSLISIELITTILYFLRNDNDNDNDDKYYQ